MKIDRNDLSSVSTSATTSTAVVESGGGRPGGAGAAGSSSDTAELSELAGKISQAVGQDAGRRADKVEQLRAQVASGNYQPDSQAIGHGIVKESLAQGVAAGSSKQ